MAGERLSDEVVQRVIDGRYGDAALIPLAREVQASRALLRRCVAQLRWDGHGPRTGLLRDLRAHLGEE